MGLNVLERRAVNEPGMREIAKELQRSGNEMISLVLDLEGEIRWLKNQKEI